MEVHTAPDLSPLAAVWACAAQPQPASCFQSFAFAQCWAKIYGGQARILVLYSAAPAWVLPFAICRGALSMLGHGLFDYADVVGAPAVADTVREQAGGIAAELLSVAGWEALDICAVPGDSPFLEFWRALAAALGAPGIASVFSRYSAAPRLSLGAMPGVQDDARSAELDGIHSRAAARLRRAQRGSRLGAVEEPAARRQLLLWMLEQKERRLQSLGQNNVLHTAEATWLGQMVADYPETAELWAYCHEAQPIAGFLTFLMAPVRYGYLLAFDPAQARQSPAIELLYFVLRQTVAEGRAFDFLTGEQGYKLRFANGSRPLLRLQVPRPHGAVLP